jgi:outer membrane protein TolC
MRFRLGRWMLAASTVLAQTPLTLADLERMALERNPTIGQTQADVRAAAGRAQQAGLYPNPTVSAVGDVDRYRTEILPKAQRAYDLYISNFRKLAAAYPQALLAQRNLFALQDAYVDSLTTAWERSVEIQGLLLTGGVELASN